MYYKNMYCDLYDMWDRECEEEGGGGYEYALCAPRMLHKVDYIGGYMIY